MSIPLLVIAGPTGVGKSAAAVELALVLGGEVVGADSMQLYRGMNIGTGKIVSAETKGVPHHMIDVWEPEERGSAGRYLRQARAVIADIHTRGRLPLLCGGTGLYIRAVIDGLVEGSKRDPAVERRLTSRLKTEGIAALRADLARCDPLSAERIATTDGFRILRALGVYEATGIPFSELQESATLAGDYAVEYVVLHRDRAELYRRIDRRVVEMFDRGLIEEVRRLAPRLGPTARTAIGYRECLQHLAGDLDPAATIAAVQRASRKYAKRQLTWFRAVPGARHVELVAGREAEIVRRLLAEIPLPAGKG